jgi:hypothetical protein
MADTPEYNAYTEIGKIPKLRKEIDQSHSDKPKTDNVSDELKKRMGIIDLIPCVFNLLSGLELTKDALTNAFKPNIKYELPCEDFIKVQREYGFIDPTSFLRVYLTDSTTVQETISNSYTKNILDDTLNSISSSKLGQLFKNSFQAFESLGSTGRGSNIANKALSKEVQATPVGNVATQMLDVVTHGSRISFPKIWAGTDYSPSLTCNLKLMSPYGHPDAIAKFIIEPLGRLMLLLAPRTYTGLTTQRPSFVALKSYGMSVMNICSPSVLEIRRGGDDNSYNEYKQPLTVDIAMTFDSVCEGFAVFGNHSDDPVENPDKDIFKPELENLTKDFQYDFITKPNAYFSTMRTMVNSFRPFNFDSADPNLPFDGVNEALGNSGNENSPDALNINNESTEATVESSPVITESSSESITVLL